MKRYPPVRTLATAAVLALGILSGPAGLAHAEPNVFTSRDLCRAAGHVWVDGRGCAVYKCPGDKQHGDRRTVREHIPGQYLGRVVTQQCDGFTGQWVTLRTESPESPEVPPRNGTIEQTDSTPTRPTRPLPAGPL